jgi:hypothetical protein
LNTNGVPDANEDINKDGQVNVLDCRIQGPQGPQGPAGPPGAAGPAGPAGSPASFSLVRLSVPSGNDPSFIKQLDVVCPVGKKVVGGGADLNSSVQGDTRLAIQDSWPAADNIWRVVAVKNNSCNCPDYNWSFVAWAICIDAP